MMKRRVFGMLLSLCLVLALIPAAAFAEDEEPTFTLEAAYTTTVERGGSAKPGKTDFKLKLMYNNEEPFDDVKPDGITITTDGEGDYDGMLTFTGTTYDLRGFIDGVYVQQVDEGKDGWDYDPTVWCLIWNNGPVAYAQDDKVSNGLLIYPTIYEEDGNGGRIYKRVEEKDPLDQMTFKNTYTKTATEETTDPDDASSDANVSALPKTGDSSNLTGWLILLAVSAAAVAGAVVYSRRRKNAHEE